MGTTVFILLSLVFGLLIVAVVVFMSLSPATKRKLLSALAADDRNQDQSPGPDGDDFRFQCRVRGALLTPAEAQFYRVLERVLRHTSDPSLPPQLRVMCKVKMYDVFEYAGPKDNKSHRTIFWNKIKNKHFDFVLTRPDSHEIVAVIELDDSSHRRESSRKGDLVKDEACAAAGLPMLRIRCAATYDPQEIARKVRSAVNTPAAAEAEG
ncbi:MAG TPA: DUF2726 domain-containing protein [Phycisphaerales bacterium]|nr:DUF2726 domain-containing protein [Phycisphaerales bacterium]